MKKILIYFLFLPLVLFVDIFRSKRSIIRKIGLFIIAVIFFGFAWRDGFSALKSTVEYSLFEYGWKDKLTNIQVSGTSMLPTIKDGENVTLKSPKKYKLDRGDIVSFKNQETESLYFLKRIVGLSGEKISIKNGNVHVDGKLLAEDYTLNSLPTFGNTFLLDCDMVTVPPDSFFVMGDNRTVSFDSRAIGFVRKEDIEGVIKSTSSTKLVSGETQNRQLSVNIDPETFLKILNEKRSKEGKPFLVTHQILNSLAGQRAGEIRDDFDGWKKKSVSLDKLLEQAGYRYNLTHEYVTFGYLTEQNIIDQIFELPIEKDEFLSPQYTEVGIGVAERTVGECRYPVISIILSWPSVPTYDQKVVDSWLKEINTTSTILANMQTWVGVAEKDQTKVRRVIEITAQGNQIATRIYNKMNAREWLTSKDYQDIKTYDVLMKEENTLTDELFGQQVKGITTEESRRL